MTVTVPTVLLAAPVLGLIVVAWWALSERVLAWAIPRYLRWYWHRLGGEGEPPGD